MSDTITIIVHGIPKAQPRPRGFAFNRGGKTTVRMYEAGTAEAWKGQIALAAANLVPSTPLEGPVRVDIDFFMPRPKRLCRKKDPADAVRCFAKPDRDNLDKAVLDCLTTLNFWHDDGQASCGELQKFYHAKDRQPGAVIRIMEQPEWPTYVPKIQP
jgi:Holliday junction resolvase RusA-like endonuclease